MPRNAKPGEIVIFQGHALAPEVRARWEAIQQDVQADVDAIRAGLREKNENPYFENLLTSFAVNATAERVLFHQFFWWMQTAEHIQATEGLEASQPAVSAAVKVVSAAKGPGFQKLVALKALDSESKRRAMKDVDEELDLAAYLNASGDRRSRAANRHTFGAQKIEGKRTSRAVTTSARAVKRASDITTPRA